MFRDEAKSGYLPPDESGLLRSVPDIRPLYILPKDPIAEEVLVPCFRVATQVDCMVGFFSSEVLASLAPGLATYISRSKNSFRLIVSPYLRPEDQAAIEAGVVSEESIVHKKLEELIVTEDLLQQHTLKCLSWLLHTGQMEIKIALMKDALFHLKVWLFRAADDVMAVHGSSNVTQAGIRKNVEQIAVSHSWDDLKQCYVTEKLCDQFEELWENKDDYCIIIPMPDAIRERLLQTYHTVAPPTEAELHVLYRRATEFVKEPLASYASFTPHNQSFMIPPNLRFGHGPFEHQERAVKAWCDADYRGILEMATGSGKTITAMIGAYRLYQATKPILIVVAAPYVPLIEQWCDEIAPFGLNPINLTIAGSAAKRAQELQRLKRRLRNGLSDVEVVVVSHDTICTSDFMAAINGFDCTRLLIADEAHNLGRPSFISQPPESFEYRLGLSATPIRQYDEKGTEALFGFFGPAVFQFKLEEAVGQCLVEYDYYIHPVYLTDGEMEEWFDLTSKIKQNAWRDDSDKPDVYLAKLLRDRRALLETASNKLGTLANLLLDEEESDLRHTLIYASDKGPEQLEGVNQLLRDRHILFHQLTAEETVSRGKTKRIIQAFQSGEIQVLTAKRVLDEGVNIPQIRKAFILASTTIERQWVQRRGRLLRTCSAIGKTHSIIHDLLALPPKMDEGLDPDGRALVRSELRRAQAFARLARNAGKPGGPLTIIDKMVDAAYL